MKRYVKPTTQVEEYQLSSAFMDDTFSTPISDETPSDPSSRGWAKGRNNLYVEDDEDYADFGW